MAKNIIRRGTPGFDINFSDRILTRAEFGKRLGNLIRKKGWSQSELARRAKIGRDSISQYVRGRSVPSPIFLEKICKALNTKPDELFQIMMHKVMHLKARH